MDRSQFFEKFSSWFEPAAISAVARRVGWLIRQGKIDAFEFVVGLVFGQMSSLQLSLRAQASAYTEPVKREAVHQRYTARAVELLSDVFHQCLNQSLSQSPEASWHQVLATHFAAVQIVDSSSFDCPESLAEIYPGCGGEASAANCKVLLRYEYLHSQFEPVALVGGKRSDPGLADQLPKLVKTDELLLTDKGFFKGAALRQIQQAGSYFLMPWPRSVSQWIEQADGTRQELNLAEQLRQCLEACLCLPKVFLGKGAETLAVRLAAFRLSQESAARHRAALREAQRKQGRTPTVEALELAGWLILITNAPVEKLPTQAMSYLYRVRWQIELVFKQCKSVLRLNVTMARTNKFRVQCEIWARLIAAVAIFAWHAHLQVACWAHNQREISFAQVATTFQQHAIVLNSALIEGGQRLQNELWKLWRQLLYTTIKGRQRSRKTTFEALHAYWLDICQTKSAKAL
jgi:IS4 transposase